MEQAEFLEKHVFAGLENLNDGFDESGNHYFSQEHFEKVLEQAEYFGIGIYKITPFYNGEAYGVAEHESFKKKATDPKWYNKAFLTFTHRQEGLLYAATYKVSGKLLARYSADKNEEEEV
ncbi:hypothetical protein [Arcticibacterium luteifluviistationis]|uniref:Uncharacterized protein n=1 Tax=Arcticibacterium luteifluviistationis TaxID=1784714 RepID=A0A2Z4GHX7_9BACT|nr:hypothetical protein [Arcticibacterium luteifluviistationis]AWW00615.1 hypothetical protein DJ013_21465 [Arcticibacterium luteifluviistationis]